MAKRSGDINLSSSDNAGRMREFAGSLSDDCNGVLLGSVMRTLWKPPSYSDEEKALVDRTAAIQMAGFAPTTEVEGMIAAQAVSINAAALECLRRAAIPEQSHEGRSENLALALKLSKTFAALVETLDRHRGKGQQVVRVEHVTVNAGGQAIVGAVEAGGRGQSILEGQPYEQSKIAYADGSSMRGEDAPGVVMSMPGNGKRKVSATRRPKPRRAEG